MNEVLDKLLGQKIRTRNSLDTMAKVLDSMSWEYIISLQIAKSILAFHYNTTTLIFKGFKTSVISICLYNEINIATHKVFISHVVTQLVCKQKLKKLVSTLSLRLFLFFGKNELFKINIYSIFNIWYPQQHCNNRGLF